MKRELEVRGKNVLVVGLARSGVAAARFLSERGARVTVTDTKAAAQLQKETAALPQSVRLALGGHEMDDFTSADFIVLSPGVPASRSEIQQARQRGVPVYAEVELAYRFLDGQIVGVTGSNGKTTTTALIGQMFEDSGRPHVVAGNIGVPLIQFAEPLADEERRQTFIPPTFIVELSSFQLETIHQFRCDIALLLNITADHLDRYPSFEEYARAKEKILANQTSQDYAVLNADNPGTAGLAGRHKAQVLLFSRKQTLKEGVFVENGRIVISRQGSRQPVLPVSDVRLRGRHNLENVLAATAAGFLSGLQAASMAETLKTFAGVEHRLEFVRRIREVAFYNDSKATNVDSAAQALQAFEQPLIVIMGGQDKGGDFRALEPILSSRGARLLIVIGAAAEKILAALGSIVPTLRARDMQEAVESAFRNAQPGDIVLLAPACASFDMFENYEHRGRVFKESVGRLV